MARYQGVYWEKGALQGCYILFQDGRTSLTVGSRIIDGPALLIDSDAYVYFCVHGANNGDPDDYFVIEDFDGPVALRYSGYIYECGGQRIRLL